MQRDDRSQSLLADSVRAHLLGFKTPLSPTYGNAVGIRMLVAFLVVGVGMFSRFALCSMRWMRAVCLLRTWVSLPRCSRHLSWRNAHSSARL